MQHLVGKCFLFDGDEYIVEEVFTYEFRCLCRDINTDTTRQFNCVYVDELVFKYEDALLEREKDYDAIVFREEDEKALLVRALDFYFKNGKPTARDLLIRDMLGIDKK